MPIDLVAYAFVEPGGGAPPCEFQEVPEDIQAYFEDHIEELQRRGEVNKSAPAQFLSDQAKDRFDLLQQGSKQGFQQAAQNLVNRLDEATDRRMNRGFFVAIRRTQKKGPAQAVVLKLDVYDKHAAAVRQTGKGEAFFEAVEDLLDLPGDLHKGAVFPDRRRDSDVVVVDRFETRYFLKALEVRQFTAGPAAVREFVRKVGEVAPDKVDDVVRSLNQRDRPITPRGFLRHTQP